MPRHPPYTLSSLITFIDHRRPRSSLGTTTPGTPQGRGEQLAADLGPVARASADGSINTGSFAEKVLGIPRPDGKTKMRGGNAEFLTSSFRNLEPLFTCQRPTLLRSPRNTGEITASVRQLAHSSSAGSHSPEDHFIDLPPERSSPLLLAAITDYRGLPRGEEANLKVSFCDQAFEVLCQREVPNWGRRILHSVFVVSRGKTEFFLSVLSPCPGGSCWLFAAGGAIEVGGV